MPYRPIHPRYRSPYNIPLWRRKGAPRVQWPPLFIVYEIRPDGTRHTTDLAYTTLKHAKAFADAWVKGHYNTRAVVYRISARARKRLTQHHLRTL